MLFILAFGWEPHYSGLPTIIVVTDTLSSSPLEPLRRLTGWEALRIVIDKRLFRILVHTKGKEEDGYGDNYGI